MRDDRSEASRVAARFMSAATTKGRLALLTTLLAVSPALAQFEGILEMKGTMSGPTEAAAGLGSTVMKMAISKVGSRIESDVTMQGMEMKTVMVRKNDTPDTLYRIDDKNKTYSVIKVPKATEAGGESQDQTKYTVKNLGQEKIRGYNTQHVLVTSEKTTIEMWTTKELFDYGTFSKMQVGRKGAQGGENFLKALRDAGADGMPLKSVTTIDKDHKMTMEVVNVEAKTLPASTFEVPAGYTETKLPGMGGLSGPGAEDAKKRLEAAMKNMTPEQRAAMEKALKGRDAAGE